MGHLAGSVEEARLYDKALDAAEVGLLRPGVASGRPEAAGPLDVRRRNGGRLPGHVSKRPPLWWRTGRPGAASWLDGATGYMVASRDPPPRQWMFYRARRSDTGRTWDTWLHWHDGSYYLFYLAQSGSQWDNISMAVSADGVRSGPSTGA